MRYTPGHEIYEPAKVSAIAESLRAEGWTGAPIVVWGDFLVTGNHRHAACLEADVEPVTITLEAVFEEAGLDFDAVWTEEGEPTMDHVEYLLEHLPADITLHYGIQY